MELKFLQRWNWQRYWISYPTNFFSCCDFSLDGIGGESRSLEVGSGFFLMQCSDLLVFCNVQYTLLDGKKKIQYVIYLLFSLCTWRCSNRFLELLELMLDQFSGTQWSCYFFSAPEDGSWRCSIRSPEKGDNLLERWSSVRERWNCFVSDFLGTQEGRRWNWEREAMERDGLWNLMWGIDGKGGSGWNQIMKPIDRKSVV